MSSNIIGPSPKKLVAPSEKVEKASGYLDDIEAPVFTIHQRTWIIKKKGIIPINITSMVSMKYQSNHLKFDNEWLEETFFTRELEFYKNFIK